MFGLEQFIQILFTSLIFVLVAIYLNFKNIRRDGKTNLLLFVSIFSVNYLIYSIIQLPAMRYPIILFVAVCITLIYKLSFIESSVLSLIGYLILLLGDFALQALFVNILNYDFSDLNHLIYTLAANFFFLFHTALIIVVKQWYQRKQHFSNLSIKFFFFVCVLFIIAITTLNLFYYNQIVSTDPTAVILFNLVACSIYFFICLFLAFIYFSSTNQRLLLEQQTKEYEQLIEYTGAIEELYENMTHQKHDFMNVLFSIKGYLDNGQFKELREYYFSSVLNHYKEEHYPPFFSSLVLIRHSGLKGILTYKLNQATTNHIKVYVNIFTDIEINEITSLDLCKTVGILIDNAIEASLVSFQKELHVGMESDDCGTSIIIANSFLQEPNLNQIFKRGYSTKGKNRGIGLYNVKETLSRYPSVLLKTTVENNLFYQELIFSK